MSPQTAIVVGLAASLMLVLAVTMSWVLGWANRRFFVPVDPRVERIAAALPGVHCGNCGYVGCGEYAEAVAAAKAKVDLCAPGGVASAQAVAAIMGVDLAESWPYRAVVHCAATHAIRLGRQEYRGEPTCSAANLVAGFQGCTYGCLGLGDCVRACTYDAIHVLEGVAQIDYRRCTGCGDCVAACPRHIISRIPFKAERVLVVACANLDFGNDVRAVCTIGCIGCKACTRALPLLTMQGHLPVLDYAQYNPEAAFDAAIEKCPMESLVWVGKPTAKDLDQVAGEFLPERVQADFQTTVDKTDWWG